MEIGDDVKVEVEQQDDAQQVANDAALPLEPQPMAVDGSSVQLVAKGQPLKRTPLQKEVLEACYEIEPFPTDEYKKALAQRLEMTVDQVSTWFANKRRREKSQKDGEVNPRESSASLPPSSLLSPVDPQDFYPPSAPAPSFPDYSELIEAAKGTIEGYQEDGPALAFVFDEPPLPAKSRPFSAGLSFQEREAAREEAKRLKDHERSRLLHDKDLKRLEQLKEKEKKAEEKKREKDIQRAMSHPDKQLMGRTRNPGGRDDLDLEWEKLAAAAGLPPTEAGTPDLTSASNPIIVRPPFPPPSLNLLPAFPPSLGDTLGSELFIAWGFLCTFPDILGLGSPRLDDLIESILVKGRWGGELLGRVNIALLRLLQADVEEAFNAGASQPPGPGNFADRSLTFYGNMLEQAGHWGFDIDSWRAHLSLTTWPEILRQVAIIASAGPELPKVKKLRKVKVVGAEGDDLVETQDGSLLLRGPARLINGSVKSAAWHVLSEAGPDGLPLSEIAARIQKSGLRDLKRNKTPWFSIAGAMSRDSLFTRVAPATFALRSVINHHNKMLAATGQAPPPPPPPLQGTTEVMELDPAIAAADAAAAALEDPVDEEEEEEEEEEDARGEREDSAAPEEKRRKEPWVQLLLERDYEALGLNDRIAALSFLVNMVNNGPTVRARMDERDERCTRLKKQIFEDARKKKQATMPIVGTRPGMVPAIAPGMVPVVGLNPSIPPPLSAVAQVPVFSSPPVAPAPAEEDDEDDEKRHQSRLDAIRQLDEDCLLRMEPLGLDRRHNRYWRFVSPIEDFPSLVSSSGGKQEQGPDICSGRIFVESSEEGGWRIIHTQQQVEALIAVLDTRGVREKDLAAKLERIKPNLYPAMPSPPLPIPAITEPMLLTPCDSDPSSSTHGIKDGSISFGHLLASQCLPATWTPPSFFGSFANNVDPRVAALRDRVVQIQAALPANAFMKDAAFDPRAWHHKLGGCKTAAELRSCLGDLEQAIFPGFLARDFIRYPRVLEGAFILPQAAEGPFTESSPATVSAPPPPPPLAEPLSWLPLTFSAIALRIDTLDASLLYDPSSGCTGRDVITGYKYVLRPPILSTAPGSSSRMASLSLQCSSLNSLRPGAATLHALVSNGYIRTLKIVPHFMGDIMFSTPCNFELPPGFRAASTAPGTNIQAWKARAAPVLAGSMGSVPGGVVDGKSKSKSKSSKAATGARAKSASKSRTKKKSKESEDEKDYGDDYDDGLDAVLIEERLEYSGVPQNPPKKKKK